MRRKAAVAEEVIEVQMTLEVEVGVWLWKLGWAILVRRKAAVAAVAA